MKNWRRQKIDGQHYWLFDTNSDNGCFIECDKNGWISQHDLLPSQRERVLTLVDGEAHIGRAYDACWLTKGISLVHSDIDGWQPLPVAKS